MNYYAIFGQFPRSLWKSSLPLNLELNRLSYEPLQSAYKRLHSCETALVRFHNNLLLAVDNRVWFCYYSIYRPLLTLSNLIYYLVDSNLRHRNRIVMWFKSYLSKRSHLECVDLDKSLIKLNPKIELRRTPRLNVGPIPLPPLHITCSWHSLASQYSFPSLRWRHPVACFFLRQWRLGITLYHE